MVYSIICPNTSWAVGGVSKMFGLGRPADSVKDTGGLS